MSCFGDGCGCCCCCGSFVALRGLIVFLCVESGAAFGLVFPFASVPRCGNKALVCHMFLVLVDGEA